MRTFLILAVVAVSVVVVYVWNSQQEFIDDLLLEAKTSDNTNDSIKPGSQQSPRFPLPVKLKVVPLAAEEKLYREKKIEKAEADAKAIMKEYEGNLANTEKREALEIQLSKVFSDNEYNESVKKIAIDALREANAKADSQSQ